MAPWKLIHEGRGRTGIYLYTCRLPIQSSSYTSLFYILSCLLSTVKLVTASSFSYLSSFYFYLSVVEHVVEHQRLKLLASKS